MTPTYHSPFSTTFPIDLNEDHQHQLFSTSKPAEAASSSSSLTYPIFINPPQEEGGYYHREFQPLQYQEEANIYVSRGGSSFDPPTLKSENDNKLKLYVCKKEEGNKNQSENNNSAKWMSSKMRLMKKMTTLDQTVSNISETSMQKFEHENYQSSPLQTDDNSSNNSFNNSSNTIRVCADCNTTKTPLWRSGPRGPKSLCNACGIRQRKARRAMAAASAAGGNGTIFAAEKPTTKASTVQHKEKKTSNSHLPFKKRCKFTAQSTRGRKKLRFEDLTILLRKISASQRVFPQDEKEAAILLMALSYGLVHG